MIKDSTPYSLKIRRALIWPTAPSLGADERELARPAPRPEPLPSQSRRASTAWRWRRSSGDGAMIGTLIAILILYAILRTRDIHSRRAGRADLRGGLTALGNIVAPGRWVARSPRASPSGARIGALRPDLPVAQPESIPLPGAHQRWRAGRLGSARRVRSGSAASCCRRFARA